MPNRREDQQRGGEHTGLYDSLRFRGGYRYHTTRRINSFCDFDIEVGLEQRRLLVCQGHSLYSVDSDVNDVILGCVDSDRAIDRRQSNTSPVVW